MEVEPINTSMHVPKNVFQEKNKHSNKKVLK